ncbi:hypothetical protein F4813DRAFT_64641 [Daldinia decipiens]|uniref:uncharacterized protein n=1 Tax=Daldinia decipiens TaxID=326647 RepID=UPI0020C52F98|nr:uncharacterized protein F4813DRAFT_64641 [Daldinia decipiens]KAI1657938.1 hypothetical protein F4813DRAFT_64641 [Daldinia decipiens]
MASSDGPQIFKSLTSVSGVSVWQPGSAEYEKENGSYFSAFEIEVKPSYIVSPNSAEQVQGLVRALRPHVLSGDCQIAIRGAGHTPFAGSANIQDGVTIDMRDLKGVKLSDDRSAVDISAGETWTNVYTELEKYGLTVAGGRVGRLGVAGFILGGGLSMFSARTGFSCDSVTEFQVVLASGETVRASIEENNDLWRSLKGGLNNFGIVTSFKMKTFSSGDIWGGLTYYMPDTFPQLLQNACDFAHDESDEDTHLMCSIGYGFGQQAVTCVMYHTKGEEDSPSLRRFTTVEPQIKQLCTMRTSTHLGFCEELSSFSGDGLRQYWVSVTIKPDVSLMKSFYNKWQETLVKIKDAEGLTFTLGFHPLTKSLLENSAKAGGNAMAIPSSDGPLFVVLINPTWKLAEDDNRIFVAVQDFITELRRLASEKESLHRYIFTNYAYKEDDVLAGYGPEGFSKLKEASEKYDPEGVFQQGTPGGFKLRN